MVAIKNRDPYKNTKPGFFCSLTVTQRFLLCFHSMSKKYHFLLQWCKLSVNTRFRLYSKLYILELEVCSTPAMAGRTQKAQGLLCEISNPNLKVLLGVKNTIVSKRLSSKVNAFCCTA